MPTATSQPTLPLLISPSAVAEMLESNKLPNNVRIVDLSSQENFLQGHIPGAMFLPFQSLISGEPPAPGKLPGTARLEEVFSYLGLEEDTHFIVCDDEGGGWAGRLIWTLDMIGHKRYSYLNGGMIAWRNEDLPLISGEGEQRTSQTTPSKIIIHPEHRADLAQILEGLDKNAFIIWDARSPQEYSGTRVVAAKSGHIPGAINVEWTSLMDANNHYKIREDAQQYLAAQGIDGTKPIITHCQTHHRSAFTYLVGKIFGYDIRAYDGSWSEWGNHPDTPVEQ